MKYFIIVFTVFFSWNTVLKANSYLPESFLVNQKLSEEQKIEQLIIYIEKSEALFIRNGSEYGAKEAADHLRMKRKKAGSKVKTAKDFIDLIASKSYMSGEPYKMKFKNGTIMNTRDMLYNELRKMEKNN
jgi:hypothetical protein